MSRDQHPLATGYPPTWAQGWGQDRYGVFAEFQVGQVRQTMRWIPPGRFLMGSPADEEGRFGNEGPQHEVQLGEGYWLADTPCTQELWLEVMGQNPSEFVSARRPVEKVSWEDAQKFFKRLNERSLDLALRLPTEAQWEYACRAGTWGATWLGELEILGERNAPLLDEVAWYGGNSCFDFDLPEGFDSSQWKEKQYPYSVSGTRLVQLKQPNPWGLYDMLGNVWEWCSDYLADSYPEGPRRDPQGPEQGIERVIRGGSWSALARFLRAACRYWYHPDSRVSRLGFRLSRGRGSAGGGARGEGGSTLSV